MKSILITRTSITEYTSGHLTSLTQSLQDTLQIQSIHITLNKDEKDLLDLARKCEACAQKLQGELQDLRSQPRSSVLLAVRKTVLGIRRKHAIEEVKEQLMSLQLTLETSLLYRLRCVSDLSLPGSCLWC